jgi:hypothetical protein
VAAAAIAAVAGTNYTITDDPDNGDLCKYIRSTKAFFYESYLNIINFAIVFEHKTRERLSIRQM